MWLSGRRKEVWLHVVCSGRTSTLSQTETDAGGGNTLCHPSQWFNISSQVISFSAHILHMPFCLSGQMLQCHPEEIKRCAPRDGGTNVYSTGLNRKRQSRDGCFLFLVMAEVNDRPSPRLPVVLWGGKQMWRYKGQRKTERRYAKITSCDQQAVSVSLMGIRADMWLFATYWLLF